MKTLGIGYALLLAAIILSGCANQQSFISRDPDQPIFGPGWWVPTLRPGEYGSWSTGKPY